MHDHKKPCVGACEYLPNEKKDIMRNRFKLSTRWRVGAKSKNILKRAILKKNI